MNLKEWAPILKLTRYRVLVLIRALIVTGSICLGSIGVWQYMQVKINRAGDKLAQIQAVQAEREKDLGDIEASIGQYRELRRQGLVGKPNREAWVEYLVATRKRIGLPEGLGYTMKPSQVLSATSDPSGATLDTDPNAPLAHDLEFELREIHEGELLAFLREFQATVYGRTRIESCRLGSPKATGLEAQCTVRFFTLPDPNQSPTPFPAGGASQ